ncbi:MAG TPA: right-handed parallel beta-helix repeat-containing protein, partial [Myxococcota bacterium]|nr:right-handed parallel beta-helix repeat-containing protein [Myxococcota bacterium]
LNNASVDVVDLALSGMDNVYYAIYFYDASISVDGATISDGNSFLLGYAYSTPPDINLQGLETGILAGSLVQISNYTASPGALYLVDSFVEEASYGVYSSGMMDLEIDDLTIENSTSTAIYVGTSYYDTDGDGVYETLTSPSLSLSHLTLTNTSGYGIYAQSDVVYIENSRIYSSLSNGVDLTASEVELADLTVDSAAGNGISVNADVLTASVVEVGSASSTGINFSGGELYLTTANVGSAGSYGVYGNGSSLTLDGVQVDQAVSDGISLTGSSLTVINSYATGLSGNGLSITGGAAEVSNNDFSDNSGYGMVCTSVSLTTCNTNDLSNNTMGAHSGCDDACGSF